MSEAADAHLVRASYVSLHAPLPDSAGPRPAACDRIGYLRFRSARGPDDPSRADAVITLMPGIFASAASMDPVARNVVRLAAERGRSFEVWAIDRRSACLEDHHGTHAAERARSVRPAFDYYYSGEEVDGRRFAGFVAPSEAEFMRELGLAQTVRDWHTVIVRELPDRAIRARKLICGGHSLGGYLTAALASWDFDGDPSTADDAGFEDCAGLAGLDTTVSISGSDGGPAGVGVASEAVARSGGAPYVNAPPFSPPIMQLPTIASVAAFQDPDAESVFNQLIPHGPDFELTLRLLYSKDAAHFATGQPSVRDLRLTNATVFGGIFDDNSAGISILRASMGSRSAASSRTRTSPPRTPPSRCRRSRAARCTAGRTTTAPAPPTRSRSTTRASRTAPARARSPTCATWRGRSSTRPPTSSSSTSRRASSATSSRRRAATAAASSSTSATTGRRSARSSS